MIKEKPINSIWTNEQWSAINENGKNIIVSAGAGSGKTAVLTERVIEKLRNGVHINELIILTFTNAAAAEMAYCWKHSNEELGASIGCKVYIIDTKRNPLKQMLINSDIDVDYDAKKGVLFYRQYLN